MKRAAAIAVVLAVLPACAVATAAAPSGRAYSGTSSLKTKVGFRLTATQVKSFAIGYQAPCDDGETLRGTYRFKPTAVRDSAFAVRGPSTGTLPDGRTTASKLRLAGRVSGRKAKGTFSIVTQMARVDGDGVATCQSGRLTWTASRQP